MRNICARKRKRVFRNEHKTRGLQTGIQQTVIVNSGVVAVARAKNGVRDELVSELTLS